MLILDDVVNALVSDLVTFAAMEAVVVAETVDTVPPILVEDWLVDLSGVVAKLVEEELEKLVLLSVATVVAMVLVTDA